MQASLFDVDMRGRIAAKLGLSPDHEILIDALDSAKRFHVAMTNYQTAVVDCEIKRLSASDRSAELTRQWNDAYTLYTNLGAVLEIVRPLLEAVEVEISADIKAERGEARAKAAEDQVDAEYQKLIAGGMPLDAEPGEHAPDEGGGEPGQPGGEIDPDEREF